jgi:hypothetical protein
MQTGFRCVHHSRTIFCRAVSNPNITIRNFFIAVRGRGGGDEQLDAGLGLVHPAMRVNVEEYGSVVVDVNGSRMDVHFVTEAGVRDHFALCKGDTVAGPCATLPLPTGELPGRR